MLLREALANRRRLLGDDHPDTLVTLGNLSVLLINRDKLAEAEPMSRETLERRLRVLGPNHVQTLVANNVLGLVLRRRGKDAEAEPYVREAAAIGRPALGPAHPETLVLIHNLAMLLISQDQTVNPPTVGEGSASAGFGMTCRSRPFVE